MKIIVKENIKYPMFNKFSHWKKWIETRNFKPKYNLTPLPAMKYKGRPIIAIPEHIKERMGMDKYDLVSVGKIQKMAQPATNEELEKLKNAPETGKYKGVNTEIIDNDVRSSNMEFRYWETAPKWYSENHGCNTTKRATVFYDVEQLVKRMPGRNRGWTKNGPKPKCIHCGVTVTELGYCPICEKKAVRRHNQQGNIITRMVESDEYPKDTYVQKDIVEYYKIEDGIKEYIDIKEINKEWLQKEEITKANFIGHVNKKSDGRGPTGWLDVDAMKHNKHRHTVSLKLDFNVQVTETNTGIFARSKIPVIKVKKELKTCPECDCKYKLKDLRRGETVCPKCGYVYSGRISITENKRWGELGGPDITNMEI